MDIEIINTGAELMTGRRLNTHAQWLCAQLSQRGYIVTRQIAIDDTGPAIRTAVAEAVQRAPLVFTTGGLGPTSDDRTRDLVADLYGLPLIENPRIIQRIEEFFAGRGRPVPLNARRQGQIPQGATIFPNAYGTAPGLAIPAPGGRWLIMLPGPPRELCPMFLQEVIPFLDREFPPPQPIVCRTLRLTGIGESFLEEKIDRPLQPFVERGGVIAYCARPGEVDLRLTLQGPDAPEGVAAAEDIVRGLVGPLIFGSDDDELETVVIRRLIEQRKTVATAESCTGGLIAHRLTNVTGASAVFMGSCVTYSDEAKRDLLGVQTETLEQHGAVSAAVAEQMAAGARARLKTDLALAVTGIAGPGGGTPEKPVGLVYLALATAREVIVLKQHNPYDRATFKEVTSQQALDLLRRSL